MLDSHGGEFPSGPSAAGGGDPASTVELIARAQDGDQHALNLLFERHHGPLRRWAKGRLPVWARDLADTDDLVQETLLATLRRLDAFEARRSGALHAYLRQAVLNRIRDELRRHRRQPEAGGFDEQTEANGDSPIELAIGGEVMDRYERALSTLSADERAAIVGRVEMGYTYEQLAEALGKPSAEAARKAAGRALIRLAERMGRDGV
jgi:RNA polymerase sigma factor (sigma-70 family)